MRHSHCSLTLALQVRRDFRPVSYELDRAPARVSIVQALPRLSSSHCSVLGTCIGERNRARFWFYVLFQSTALAVAIGILNTSFVWRRTLADWVGRNALTLVTLLVLWVLQLSVIVLGAPCGAETASLT